MIILLQSIPILILFLLVNYRLWYQGCTKIPGGECHSHRNWDTEFNLVVHVRKYGGRLGTSVDAQVSQRDSTVHVQRLFLPK